MRHTHVFVLERHSVKTADLAFIANFRKKLSKNPLARTRRPLLLRIEWFEKTTVLLQRRPNYFLQEAQRHGQYLIFCVFFALS